MAGDALLKRLAIYDDAYDFGGHELMLSRLLHGLGEDKDWEVLVLFSPENRRFVEEQGFSSNPSGSLRVEYLSFSNPRRFGNLAALFSLGKIRQVSARLRVFKPDVVLVAQGGIDSSTIGLLASRLSGYRTLSYIPNLNGYSRNNPSFKNRLRDLLNRPFHRLPHDYIVIRTGHVLELRARGFKGAIHIVHNGIDFSRLNKISRIAARQELKLEENAYWIGSIGRIDLGNKGQDMMVRALIQEPLAFAGANLLIVGDGPDLSQLRELIITLGLEDRCRILPFRKDLSAVYSALDAVAIPSKSEGVPLVMLEAMFMGLPIIASAIDGMLDILPESWLFPPRNYAEMAQVVSRIRKSAPNTILATHRHLAETQYDPKLFLTSFKAILK